MRNLNDTITRLAALKRRPLGARPAGSDRLAELSGFGSNPGALRALCHVPGALGAGAPLVVVLHGCTQDAAGYDRGSGWSQLADELGFAVLYPEQQRGNNPNTCFNWFNSQDTRRGSGEALSIHQMVTAMIAQHDLDPARVYVTGLSAGGGMASVMLATYPEVFAGGAIIAGLPYGTANSIPEAFDRMRAHGGPASAALGDLVSAASDHDGPWPTISVWHGDSDGTVSHGNAALIVAQWQGLHGVTAAPDAEEKTSGGHLRRSWRNSAGREVIEEYRIKGLGHGTPLSTQGDEAYGAAGPYMLEAGISSTRRIAAFWGLDGNQARPVPKAAPNASARPAPSAVSVSPAVAVSPAIPVSPAMALTSTFHRVDAKPEAPNSIQRIIEDALRAAGLMRDR